MAEQHDLGVPPSTDPAPAELRGALDPAWAEVDPSIAGVPVSITESEDSKETRVDFREVRACACECISTVPCNVSRLLSSHMHDSQNMHDDSTYGCSRRGVL